MTATPSRWHAEPWEEVAIHFSSREEGLSRAEVDERQARFGANQLPHPTPPSFGVLLLRQFRSPLIAVLLVAALLALAVGDSKDALFIAGVLLLNAVVGGLQEWRAERRSHALRQLLRVKALTIRDGVLGECDAELLVPGDRVLLESGRVVPADLRLQSSHNLSIDESLLTGESQPVRKCAEAALPIATPLAERCTMTYAACTVVQGRAQGVVVATAMNTEVGRLAADLQEIPAGRPPLLLRLERFSRNIALVVLIAALSVGWLAIARGGLSLVDALTLAVALAVSAIPEGLPVALTVALAVASHHMALRQVIVRRLPAVEGLGSCTLIASDKTGTLTCNQLSVQEVRLGDPSEPEHLAALLEVAVLCNEAHWQHRGGRWQGHGDPTDLALLRLAAEQGCTQRDCLMREPRCHAIPFEPEQRFAASFHRCSSGAVRVAVKGAPEQVLAMCALPEAERPRLLGEASDLARRGLRVLALAQGLAAAVPSDPLSLPSGLSWLGMVGLMDPLRPGVPEAIQRCHQAGIKVWMITGDHPSTAAAIARQLGLLDDPDAVVDGVQLAACTPGQLQRLVACRSVFARMAPHQKLQLVKAAQQAGHFVAVTGDGVNDAPALRAAQIGIAMGRSGTDVARDAADLVLTNDGFDAIVAGVEEGRIAYANVRKVIALLISCGAAEIVLIALAVASALPLPLLPVQLLWLNLVTNGIQDVALAFEPAEGDVLLCRPRPTNEPLFDRLMLRRTLLAALVMGLVGFGVYSHLLQAGWSLAAARNALLLQMVLFENVQIGNCRLERQSVFQRGPLASPVLLIGMLSAFSLHLVMMHSPFGMALLGTQPLPVHQWLLALALSLTVLLAVEVQKWGERCARSV